MKVCNNCGLELMDDAATCLRCGAITEKKTPKASKSVLDIFWFLISFAWPVFGIFLTVRFWKGDFYKANICLIGTILSLVVVAVLLICLL